MRDLLATAAALFTSAAQMRALDFHTGIAKAGLLR